MLILMMHLSEMVLKDGISRLYGFCDCTYLSPLRRVEKEDDRCDYLYRVFACNDGKNKYQLFFLPYIEDRDWMLVVICPWIALVQWLDPLGAQNEPPEFAQTIINREIIKFSAEYRKDIPKIKKNPFITWQKIECPRQPPCSKESGYYVGRYMIKTIALRQMFIPEKVLLASDALKLMLNFYSRINCIETLFLFLLHLQYLKYLWGLWIYFAKTLTYSQTTIDKLRERWNSYVTEYPQPNNDEYEDDDDDDLTLLLLQSVPAADVAVAVEFLRLLSVAVHDIGYFF
ncbi:uncharacterized protein [Spinacia oleracea]|uniref:Ubiquitin-like protease family profile domain-containing protein n=1 Tax=Spinacia oleracea TaxID=3562 RepID=A0ABM3RRB0_SPIOL|nr:uncharacterized protein LOC130471853 [Spinacia oleracea]